MKKEMNMKPMGDLLLVKEHEKKDKTKSGIILMDGMDNYVHADVVAVGDGLFTQTGDRIPVTVKVGDHVVIHKNEVGKHKRITIDDVEYLLVRESEIALINVQK
jgi:chaperonin GroES